MTLEDGVLGYCSRSVMALSVQNVKYKKKDYLNIRIQKNLRWNLLKYVYWKHYMECCKYCRGMLGDPVKPGIQINE